MNIPLSTLSKKWIQYLSWWRWGRHTLVLIKWCKISRTKLIKKLKYVPLDPFSKPSQNWYSVRLVIFIEVVGYLCTTQIGLSIYSPSMQYNRIILYFDDTILLYFNNNENLHNVSYSLFSWVYLNLHEKSRVQSYVIKLRHLESLVLKYYIRYKLTNLNVTDCSLVENKFEMYLEH